MPQYKPVSTSGQTHAPVPVAEAHEEDADAVEDVGRLKIDTSKIKFFACMSLTNTAVFSVCSVLASFFPQQAEERAVDPYTVGVIFAIFSLSVLIASPIATIWMTHLGRVQVYLAGVIIIAVSTLLFSVAVYIPDGIPFVAWCLVMRILQGIGSGLEGTAAYALIADLDISNASFYLGAMEISTGLGYMIGPPVGGYLYSIGGFPFPFLVLGMFLLASISLIYMMIPQKMLVTKREGSRKATSIYDLMYNPVVIVMVVSSTLSNCGYSFLEPSLGNHAMDHGLVSTPAQIGLLFLVPSAVYTLSCPIAGFIANRNRLGPWRVTVAGLVLEVIGFFLIGPSPFFRPFQTTLTMKYLIAALLFMGIGDSMAITPNFDIMLLSVGDDDTAINSLSSLQIIAFSLGQMVGPLLGSSLSESMGFSWASTTVAVLLLMTTAAVVITRMNRLRSASSQSKRNQVNEIDHAVVTNSMCLQCA